MANIKITQLTEIVAPANEDVLPIVDVSGDITQKVQAANLPISTATQTALDAKQATLVSGTNIKTINSTSLLGSGDIAIAVNPAGTAGQIQFSDGSAFAADSNLFWDNTNKRLGVGTASPTSDLHIIGKDNTSARSVQVLNQQGAGVFSVANDRIVQIGDFTAQGYTATLSFIRSAGASRAATFTQGNTDFTLTNPNGGFVANGLQTTLKGSGSTSATTSLLVQNSSGTELMKVRDDGTTYITTGLNVSSYIQTVAGLVIGSGSPRLYQYNSANANLSINSTGIVASTSGYSTSTASAVLEAVSTTQGFLPPRMTTTQKNAISSPAAGLIVYDTDTNKLCCYNGTTWNDLF